MNMYKNYNQEIGFTSLREQFKKKENENIALDKEQTNQIEELEKRIAMLEDIVFKADTEKTLNILDNMQEGEEQNVSFLTNVDLTEKAISIKPNTIVTMDLNEKEINALTPNLDAILVEDGATLTINGNGLVTASDGGNGFTLITNGKLIINGGEFKSGKDENDKSNACVYARGNGQVEIYGGKFSSFDGAFVLNKKDSDRTTTSIKVYGGEFVNFNPSDNASEIPQENFVAEGYKVESYVDGDNTIYKVVKE